MKGKLVTVITGLILLVILVLYLLGFQVREGQKAFVTRFGKVARTQTEPGLYWKWPWPIEAVHRFDARLRVFESAFQQTMTRDEMSLIVSVATGWSVEDPVLFSNSVRTYERGQENLRADLADSKNSVVGQHDLAHFVSRDPKQQQFEQIEAEIMKPVAKKMAEKYGIKVHFVHITQLGLPTSVAEDVFKLMEAERSEIAKNLRSAGEGEADRIRAEAERDRRQILAKAEAEAKRIRGQGDAEAAAYYDVFKKNPKLTIFLAELEALRKLKERTTVILDQNTPPFTLLANPPQAKQER